MPPSRRRVTTIVSPCPAQVMKSPGFAISDDRQMTCQLGASTAARSRW